MTLKSLIVVLVVLFIFLQYELWFADNGLRQTAALKSHLSAQKKQNLALAKKNTELEGDVKVIKEHPEAVEALARRQLGMIKSDETYYQFVKPAPDSQSAPKMIK